MSKKIEYFREMLALMLNSLINEEKFGTAKSFKETCVKIREYIDFDEMYEYIQKHTDNLDEVVNILEKNNVKVLNLK